MVLSKTRIIDALQMVIIFLRDQKIETEKNVLETIAWCTSNLGRK